MLGKGGGRETNSIEVRTTLGIDTYSGGVRVGFEAWQKVVLAALHLPRAALRNVNGLVGGIVRRSDRSNGMPPFIFSLQIPQFVASFVLQRAKQLKETKERERERGMRKRNTQWSAMLM